MNNKQVRELRDEFLKIASIARVDLKATQLDIELLPAPHRPPKRLPAGKMAVYTFQYRDRVLKVGKAGPKSNARYTSQHYNPNSAQSTLAASLLKESTNLGIVKLDEQMVGKWIKQNTSRINFCLDALFGKFVLTLLEAYLQCRLRPAFEGFASQR